MKKVFVLFALALLNGSLFAHTNHEAASQNSQETPHYHEVGTKELEAMIRSDKPIFILDARSKEYQDGKRLPGAKFVSYNASEKEVEQLIPSKGAIVVVYCVGPSCPAGKWLADRLVKYGYTNVWKYTDGIQGWIQAGNKVETVQ